MKKSKKIPKFVVKAAYEYYNICSQAKELSREMKSIRTLLKQYGTFAKDGVHVEIKKRNQTRFKGSIASLIQKFGRKETKEFIGTVDSTVVDVKLYGKGKKK